VHRNDMDDGWVGWVSVWNFLEIILWILIDDTNSFIRSGLGLQIQVTSLLDVIRFVAFGVAQTRGAHAKFIKQCKLIATNYKFIPEILKIKNITSFIRDVRQSVTEAAIRIKNLDSVNLYQYLVASIFCMLLT